MVRKLRRLDRPWQIVDFGSMIAAIKKDGRSPRGRNLLAATGGGLLIGLRTMNNRG